jgi:small basic protein
LILIPIIALALGLFLPIMFGWGPLSGDWGRYIAVTCLAGLDTVLGGIRSGLEGKFRTDVFYTGFVANVLIAFFFAWLGDQLGINLYLAAALVLGTRIFINLSLIRRWMLTKWQDAQERRKREREQSSQTQAATAPAQSNP